MSLRETVAKNLRRLRHVRNLSPEELAEPACLSWINLGEQIADKILNDFPAVSLEDPTAPTLKDDAIDLEVEFFTPAAEHREFLGLHQVFNNLAASGILVHPPSPFGARAF